MSSYEPSPRGIDDVIAHGPDGASSLASWSRQVASIARALPEASVGSEIALAFRHDRALCAAALFASFARGHTAALPADAGRARVMPLLARVGNVGFVHDTGAGRGLDACALVAGVLPEEHAASCVELERMSLLAFDVAQHERVAGSELVARIDALVAQLVLAPSDRVASSLSPTSLAGLLATTLAPLRAGALFDRVVPGSDAELVERVRDFGASVLVVEAARLAMLAEAAPGELRPLERVFFVGAPFDEALVERLASRHALQVRPLEGFALEDPARLPRARATVRELEWSVREPADAMRLRTRIPENYAFFEGHFEGHPVLPGAVQLAELVLAPLRRMHPDLPPLRAVIGLKFLAPIAPGDTLELVLRATRDGYAFELELDGTRCSAGELRFDAAQAADPR